MKKVCPHQSTHSKMKKKTCVKAEYKKLELEKFQSHDDQVMCGGKY